MLRRLALATASAVLVGVGSVSAIAAPDSSQNELDQERDALAEEMSRESLARELRDETDEPGVYIARFESPAPPLYEGGIPGLTATAVPEGERFTTDTAEVQDYLEYIAEEQAEAQAAIDSELGRSADAIVTWDVAVNGAAYELTPEEAAQLALVPEVAHIEREREYELHTDAGPGYINADHIWEAAFRGASDSEYKGEGVVVGIIDTGISPENPSFAEVGPIDGYVHTWDGEYFGHCDPSYPYFEEDFPCNDKLIGAYNHAPYDEDEEDGPGTARDTADHGTHVASTSAGNEVDIRLDAMSDDDEDLRISGVAPHAHIISHAVCTPGCAGVAILSAINAVVDGPEDVVNFSIGSPLPSEEVWISAENLGWLAVNAAGVRVAHSAGNSGPNNFTAGSSSDLPWVTSVGASEHDRAVLNQVQNIEAADGATMTDVLGKGFTAGTEGSVPLYHDIENPYCYLPVEDVHDIDFSDPAAVEGTITICLRGGPHAIGRVQASEHVADLGAEGFVLVNGEHQAASLNADEFALPGVHVPYTDGMALLGFLAEHGEVTASLSGYEITENPWTGQMASFSSRGPNQAEGVHGLVPSFTAPGVDIIAGYGSYEAGGDYPVEWGVMSGTSMSSPHAAGAYALLAQARPEWSHAQTQSAAQLTARSGTPQEDGTTSNPHDEGSGYIDVGAAADAGFILDITEEDYLGSNPAEGGDTRDLNAAELANMDLDGSYEFARTFSSTLDVDVTWSVDYVSEEGMTLTGPESISIPAGGEAVFEVTMSETGVGGAAPQQYGRITLTPDVEGIPSATIPAVATIVPTAAEGDIAVLGDSASQISGLLEDAGYPAWAGGWDHLDLSQHPVVILNNGSTPGNEEYLSFLEEAEALGVGVVFLDQWGAGTILTLSEITGNPEGRAQNDAAGETSLEVLAEHEILDGYAPGDVVVHETANNDWNDVAWFTGFTSDEYGEVTVLADVAKSGVTQGQSIAVREGVDTGLRHVLMSTHGATGFTGPSAFTDESLEIFFNAIDWASEATAAPVESELEFTAPDYVMEGDTIVIEGTVTPGGDRHIELREFIAPVPMADGERPELDEDGEHFRFEVPAPVPGERSFEIHVAETDEAFAVESERFTVTVLERVFTDVRVGDGFFDEIMWLAERGITTGYPDGTFRPLAHISREAMAAFVYRYAGSPEVELPEESPFTDIDESEGFYTEMVWVAQEGISEGYADGTFRPRANITREAIAAFLYRAAGEPAVDLPARSPFIDVPPTEGFYTEIVWMYQQGITTGYAGDEGLEFQPRGSLTREAMAAFMYRFDDAVGVEAFDN